jgi:hypothetical protein
MNVSLSEICYTAEVSITNNSSTFLRTRLVIGERVREFFNGLSLAKYMQY